MILRSGRTLFSESGKMSTTGNSTGNEPPSQDQPTIQQIVMTPGMLQQLLSGVQNLTAQSPTNVSTSNFAACKSRFDGSPGSDVEAFIDSISVYKECLDITDEHAIKGLSMLLTDASATWWQGVKSSIGTFNEAIDSLRHAFGYSKPPHVIYRELFSKEQGNEKTDIFVSKARSLLSHLKGASAITEHVQLDMVYGLLSPNIKEKLSRDQIKNFKELIETARVVEQTLYELKHQRMFPQNTDKQKVQCAYCRNYGHLKSECKKLARLHDSQGSPNRPTINQNIPLAPSSNSGSGMATSNKSIVCYGCNSPGFIKSNCPNCASNRQQGNTTLSAEFLVSNFTQNDQAMRPLTFAEIEGHHGLSYLDSGAQSSIAGATLRNILLRDGVPYTQKSMEMTLADGRKSQVDALLFDVDVTLQDRTHHSTLINIPQHSNSRTLLGADFLKRANIVLDVPNDCWFYGDSPMTSYCFAPAPDHMSSCTLHTVDLSELKLREDEGPTLSSEERTSFNSLLETNYDLFQPSNVPTPYAEHSIVLTDDTPIAVPPYRMSPLKKEGLRKEIDKLLAEGVIEECESPYAAPVVLVPKKDGSLRLTVDYRKLNAITRADRYPLPRIDDTLHAAKQTRYMTTLDLKSGYHQVSVRECDRDKTAFICPFGTFRYTRMPFGLRNAPSTFQRMIDRFRAGLQNIRLLGYLDDLIILSSTFSEHVENIQQVFDRLRLFKLKLNRSKCCFIRSSVKYLGHIITEAGIQPDPNKVSAIANIPPPKNVKQVLSFLQTCSWYRRFIDNFAAVSRPLTSLTKKNAEWIWGPDQSKAFERLKTMLTSDSILRQADPTQPYILKTDASSYAIGACLLQGEGSEERPIEYASRLLTSAEQNYSTTEREALAVVWSVTDKFRGYLECATTIIKSDHQPLKWLMSLRSPSGRLARWSLSLQHYDLRIDYTPGRTNVIADMLSRPPSEQREVNLVTVDLPHQSAADLRKEQLQDPDIAKIIGCFENPGDQDVDYKKWTERGYVMNNGVLYRYVPDLDEEDAQQIVPKSQIPRILTEYHDSPLAGHYGVDRTYQRIAARYFWPGMRRTITDYVSKCPECQKYKATNLKPAGQLQTPIQCQRFEVLSIDLFGPLPVTPDGYRWIFIIEDTASRWTELFPLQVASAEHCARCLIDEVILRYGLPRRVVSDNGVQFVSAVMQQVSYCLGFKQSLTPVYHPASNPVERKNRDLKTQLSILVADDHVSWKDKLPAIRFSMNTVKSESTGFSAAYLTFGRDFRTPDDVQHDLRSIVESDNFVPQITPYLLTLSRTLREARDNHEKHQDRVKQYADKHLREGPTYNIGEKVLVDVHALSKSKDLYSSKFAPRRDGPYVIRRVVTPTTYEISSVQSPDEPLGKYHASALTPFKEGTRESNPVRPLRKRGRPPKKTTLDEPVLPSDGELIAIPTVVEPDPPTNGEDVPHHSEDPDITPYDDHHNDCSPSSTRETVTSFGRQSKQKKCACCTDH